MGLELALTLLALGASLWKRPWRMLGSVDAVVYTFLSSVLAQSLGHDAHRPQWLASWSDQMYLKV